MQWIEFLKYLFMQKPSVVTCPKAIMAEAKTLKIARLVALAHIVVGILLFIFGIVDRVEGYFWTGEGCFGIWCGIWVRLLHLNIAQQ